MSTCWAICSDVGGPPHQGSSRGPEESDDGQDPPVVVAVRRQAELVEDRGDVALDAFGAEVQASGDTGVMMVKATGEQPWPEGDVDLLGHLF